MVDDPYKYFRIEARDLVDQMGKGVLDLEKGPAAPDLTARLLRLAHTLKGAARVVKQREIADLAHAMEDALSPLRNGEPSLSTAGVSGVLAILDDIRTRVVNLGRAPEEASATERAPEPSEPFETLRADIADADALLQGIVEVNAQLATMRRAAGAFARVRDLTELLSEPGAAARRPPAQIRAIGEELLARVTAIEQAVMRGVERLDREARALRDSTERMRLLPAELMFTPLERAARDAAQTAGKRIGFATKGGDLRLEGNVLGVAQNALVQLVRNAVAHGIEDRARRVSAGKPAEGRITVEIARRGNRVAFACHDDGGGIDLDGVRRAAQRRGMPLAEVRALGSEELVRLLLQGGLSTTGAVTELAGRGIGLDIVRAAAVGLGGTVDVRTEPGHGTTIEIVAPISLASIEAVVAVAGDRTLAIPMDAVRRTLRVAATELMGSSAVVDGEVMPFAHLSRCLGDAAGARAMQALVVGTGADVAVIGVTRLIGTETVVLRPLPAATPASAVVAGTWLDAEGNPQIVLDPASLVSIARQVGGEPQADRPARAPILVVDDSLTTRMLEQSILESAGYEVDLASSGEEGLEKARRRRYALFLVDVEMPGMDGFTFVATTRGEAELRDIPSILITSRSAPEDKRRGEESGARAYIVKSEFDQTELLDRIRRLTR